MRIWAIVPSARSRHLTAERPAPPTPASSSSAALYVLGHALAKGALFMLSGVLNHHFGSYVDRDLHGKEGSLRFAGALVAVGGLALADLAPFATFNGKGIIDDAAGRAGGLRLAPVLIVA